MNRPAALLSFAALAATPNIAQAQPTAGVTMKNPLCVSANHVIPKGEADYYPAQQVEVALSRENNLDEGVMGRYGEPLHCLPMSVHQLTREVRDGLTDATLELCLPDMRGGWETGDDCETIEVTHGVVKKDTQTLRISIDEQTVLDGASALIKDYRERHAITSVPPTIVARVMPERDGDVREVTAQFGSMQHDLVCNVTGNSGNIVRVGELFLPTGRDKYPVVKCSYNGRGDGPEQYMQVSAPVPYGGPTSLEEYHAKADEALEVALTDASLHGEWFGMNGERRQSMMPRQDNEEQDQEPEIFSTIVFPAWMGDDQAEVLSTVEEQLTAGLTDERYKLDEYSTTDAYGAFVDLSEMAKFNDKITGPMKFRDAKGQEYTVTVEAISLQELMSKISEEWTEQIRLAFYNWSLFKRGKVNVQRDGLDVTAQVAGMEIGFKPNVPVNIGADGAEVETRFGTFTFKLSTSTQ